MRKGKIRMENIRETGGRMSLFCDPTANGNQATVKTQVSGTNTGPLSLPMPGMPSNMPPTGKKVSAKDVFVVTVEGDKVSHLQVDSPAGGGLLAILAQLGVKMPGM
jgi:hypothetical protein